MTLQRLFQGILLSLVGGIGFLGTFSAFPINAQETKIWGTDAPIPDFEAFQSIIIPENTIVLRDIPFVTGGGPSQSLDIYLPADYKDRSERLPLVVMIHGGGWFAGDKGMSHYMLNGSRYAVLAAGYALASVNYRLTDEGAFPSQLEDCKSAIRFLRAHADEYRLDPDRFAAWGGSAGGNLAAIVGTAGDQRQFDVGENLEFSSKVQAVCDFCGSSDLTLAADDPNRDAIPLIDKINLYVGGPIQDRRDVAVEASPVTWITPETPPFLIVHGRKDSIHDFVHAEILEKRLKEAGCDAELLPLEKTDHDGPEFVSPNTLNTMIQFLDRVLKK